MIWKFGDLEIWRFGNLQIWKFGNLEMLLRLTPIAFVEVKLQTYTGAICPAVLINKVRLELKGAFASPNFQISKFPN